MENRPSKMSEVLEIIKTARTQRDLSEEYMADQLGISKVTYSKMENGEIPMSMMIFDKILEVLGVDVEKMYEKVWADVIKRIGLEDKRNKGFSMN